MLKRIALWNLREFRMLTLAAGHLISQIKKIKEIRTNTHNGGEGKDLRIRSWG
jgi:hypothetical protein